MKLGLKIKDITEDAYYFVVPLRETEIIIKKQNLVFYTSIILDFMLAANDNDLMNIGYILRSINVNKNAFESYTYPKANNEIMVLLTDIKLGKVIDSCIENYLDNNNDLLIELAKRFVYTDQTDTNDFSVLSLLYDEVLGTILKTITK